MILFISHASEDQADFVRPLADALSKEYEKVWYSEYELTLGDSLLERIDSGLKSCDFAVVVLSKPFFEKKWPRAELDGLFALETRTRKIILPIWKDITAEEVRSYSPILAGKFAVSADTGLPNVLEQIRLAVNVSARQRQLTVVDSATQRVQALRQTVANKQQAERLLQSEMGAALVLAGIDALWDTIQNILSADADVSNPLKFEFARPVPATMYAHTLNGMHLGIHRSNVHINSAIDAQLKVNVFRREWDRFGFPVSDLQDLYETIFRPSFSAGDNLVWIDSERTATYRTEELAGRIVDLFIQHLETEIASTGQDANVPEPVVETFPTNYDIY